MLNVNELENRWRKYKIKSYIPYAVITISTVAIVTIIYIITPSKDIDNIPEIKQTIQKKKIEETIVVAKILEENNDEITVDIVNNIEQNTKPTKNNVILSPSLDFMSNMQHSNIYSEDEITPNYQTQTVIKKVKIIKPEIITENIIEEPEEKIKETTTNIVKTVNIIRRNDQEDIEYVIKRFKKNSNPALSLFIAKKYYSLGEYHKSYNYALITNELNDNIDKSWIIFAKSLVKLNQKDEAIKTLKKYIEHSHSNQARILLDEIKAGDFK